MSLPGENGDRSQFSVGLEGIRRSHSVERLQTRCQFRRERIMRDNVRPMIGSWGERYVTIGLPWANKR
jgi:hypothetical protein